MTPKKPLTNADRTFHGSYCGKVYADDGTRHGTLAMIRRGCQCPECMDKRRRMKRRGMRGIL